MNQQLACAPVCLRVVQVSFCLLQFLSAPNNACCAWRRFKLFNIRQSQVFYYLGASTAPNSPIDSSFTLLGGTRLAIPVTVTQANPFEPTQASTFSLPINPCLLC